MAKVEPEKAKGFKFPSSKIAYNKRDLLLYANSIGAYDLKFTYENTPGFAAFPTYPVVLSLKGDSYDVVPFGAPSPNKKKQDGVGGGIPGIPKYDPNMILHGEQSVEVLKTLPLDAPHLILGTTVLGVYDKGKGMLIKQESIISDESGVAYVKLISGVFVRGLGGFGGEKQPPEKTYSPPSRAPDATAEFTTSPYQALLYRLSGDYNPLHADPSIAKKVGFPGPILHGLASFGIAAQCILKTLLNNDPSLFKAIRVRFASPVFPGETLVTEMWKDGTDIIFQTKVKERNVVVISNAVLETNLRNSKL